MTASTPDTPQWPPHNIALSLSSSRRLRLHSFCVPPVPDAPHTSLPLSYMPCSATSPPSRHGKRWWRQQGCLVVYWGLNSIVRRSLTPKPLPPPPPPLSGLWYSRLKGEYKTLERYMPVRVSWYLKTQFYRSAKSNNINTVPPTPPRPQPSLHTHGIHGRVYVGAPEKVLLFIDFNQN